MTKTAITFNQVSSEIKIYGARGKRGKRGGGSGLKVKGVQDVLSTQSETLSTMERLENGSATLSRKQRMFCTAFVRAVARRRSFDKKVSAPAQSRFVAAQRKAG